MQKNDDIISKYGSIEALKGQSNLYRMSHCNESKLAYNDYKSYTRWQKFINKYFHLYSANNNTNKEEDDKNGDNRADIVGQNNNSKINSNNNRESQNEMLSCEESFDLKCYNCWRKQKNLL